MNCVSCEDKMECVKMGGAGVKFIVKHPRLEKHCDWSNRVYHNSKTHASYHTHVHYI